MTSAQVVETSVTNNSSFQNYPHPDDHTIRTTDTPGFKPFTMADIVPCDRLLKKAYCLGLRSTEGKLGDELLFLINLLVISNFFKKQ